jgi:hypothetical protein
LRGGETTCAIEGGRSAETAPEHEARDKTTTITIGFSQALHDQQELKSRAPTKPKMQPPDKQHLVHLRRLQQGKRRLWAPSPRSFRSEPQQAADIVHLHDHAPNEVERRQTASSWTAMAQTRVGISPRRCTSMGSRAVVHLQGRQAPPPAKPRGRRGMAAGQT